MMDDKLAAIIQAITTEMQALAQAVLKSNGTGTNPKTGKKTLAGSHLQESIRTVVAQEMPSVVIQALFAHYVEYIEKGRKPCTGKQPPIDALRDWALAHGIPTDNSTLYLVARAIWRDGQQPRPIMATFAQQLQQRWDAQWANDIAQQLMQPLTEYFN